jgi:glucan phosphoethanolaminetransferase (alkaline phosphatase superfamily)
MRVAWMIFCFAVDVALWFAVPCAFLLVYVFLYHQPATAVVPHLELAGMPLLAVFLFRLVLTRSSASRTVYLLVSATLMSSALMLFGVYYALVLIGLHSWGGVVAWNVIPTFFLQASVIEQTWNIPSFSVIVSASLAYGLAIVLCRRYLHRIDWVPFLDPHLPGLMFTGIILIGLAAMASVGMQFCSGRLAQNSEPLSLTLFPQSSGIDLEGFVVNPVTAQRMDRVQDAARHSYAGLSASSKGVRRKNLVIILVDALRPDHMQQYGYDRDTTPHLTRIAHEHSTRVMQEVHSTCADTACSVFSLFSSTFPGHFAANPFMLHHVLWRSGYRIHLILSGDKTYFYSRKKYYGHVDTFYDGTQAPGFYVNDDQLVIDKLATMPRFDGNPVMFQFHLMSAHILRKRDDGHGPFVPEERYLFPDSHDSGPGGEVLIGTRNFYDDGVVRADEVIGQLMALLKDKGYLENALVVITADHGESLGEHGLYHHANSAREEVLRIPWIMYAYGPPLQIPNPPRAFASQVDIAPTILRELGLPQPSSWVGRPLQATQNLDISFFTEHAYHGLIDHRDPSNQMKYTVDEDSGAERVFNLSLDPHEDHDLHGEVPAVRLKDWRKLLDHEMGITLRVR